MSATQEATLNSTVNSIKKKIKTKNVIAKHSIFRIEGIQSYFAETDRNTLGIWEMLVEEKIFDFRHVM